MKTKVVLLPIEVPEGEWCRDFANKIHCVQFQAFSSHCQAGFYLDRSDGKVGYRKPDECRNLKDADTDNEIDK
jgi:hypothetical protein